MLTLLYHNILETPCDDCPAIGGQVTLDTFRSHIRHFRKRLLDPRDVNRCLCESRPLPNGVLITFDDGAAGILHAAEVLAEAGVAGVAFVCPGAIVSGGVWFFRLADAMVRTRLARLSWDVFDFPLTLSTERCKAYDTLILHLFSLSSEIRSASMVELLSLLAPEGTPCPALATLDEASAHRVAETGGMLFANHSWSHADLDRLDPTELTHEIMTADQWLHDSGLPFVPWFSFPRGIHNAAVRKAVAKTSRLAFGAFAYEPAPGVLPRIYLCDRDANPTRLWTKTVRNGWLYGIHRRLFHEPMV